MSDSNTATQVIVQEAGEGKYVEEIRAGNHILFGDEPKNNGGQDKGPSPYEFLLASLGTCTSITLRMYADLKKIPLKKVIVKLSIKKVHADDCANCETNNIMIDHITRSIELEGDLSQEQREKLLDIANKCPVHRTLTSKFIIETGLV
jgi:putative redox protein